MWMIDNTVFETVKDPNTDPKRTMPKIKSVSERIGGYDQIEETYTEEEALNEAARCLKCPTHWCQKECPAGVPVTDFIAKTRAKDYEGAYELIRSASMLPEICSRVCPQEKQCQSNCTRGINTQSVGIGRLERFVVEQHYASGIPEKRSPSTGKKVAVIGSGPSGLSAAQRLTELGHAVTVYEKADRPGGLLEYGIPNMKLEKGVVERKISSLEAQGVTFRTGVSVGEDVSAESLKADYDAVILAIGTGNARSLNPEGASGTDGIVPAVTFLTNATKGYLNADPSVMAKDKHVVIVGGGDTGNDCVGTSIRQGALSVTQIEMMPQNTEIPYLIAVHPAREKEKKHDFSQEECERMFGDPHIYQSTVSAVRADETGRICAATIVSLDAAYDKMNRLTLTRISGSEKEIPCGLLIVAAGFLGPQQDLLAAFGVETTARSNAAADHYATNVPKVYACGDCRSGQSLVVKAMCDGRDCANAVHAELK